jgi:hypothetical protein
MKDGQMVDRLGGYSGLGPSGKKTYSGYTTVEPINKVLQDDEVAEHQLEAVKAGLCPGLAYVSDEEAKEDGEGAFSDPDPELVGEVERLKVVTSQQQQVIDDLDDRLNTANNGNDELTARVAELESELVSANERVEELEGAGSGEPADPVVYTHIQGYNPSDYNQPQVLEYLAGASPAEVQRVQEAEGQGQNRQQIMGYKAAE